MTRKITVLSDFSNDDSLTPEQEQALEVKVDAMLDPEQPEAKPEPLPKAKKAAARKVAAKPKAAPKAVPVIAADDPPAVEAAEAFEASEAAAPADEPPGEPPVEPPGPEPDNDQVSGAPPLPADDDSSPAPAPETDLAPESESIPDPDVKKYRPPDGPLPFKRAEPDETAVPPAFGDDLAARSASDRLGSETAADTPLRRPAGTARAHKVKKVRRHSAAKFGLGLLLLLLAAAIVPASRVAVLNLVHVRSSLKIRVVDNVTRAPLSGVSVAIGNDKAVTDQAGQATLTGLSLGTHDMVLQKPGFASASRREFVDRQPAAVADITLTAEGRQYVINVVDSLSRQLVPAAEASAGKFTASGDAKGRILLTTGQASTVKTATVVAAGYQPLPVALPADTSSPQTVRLVPSGTDFYTLTPSGSSGIYQVDLAGKNAKLLLPATGSETGIMTLVADDSGSQLAVVSTRDQSKDKAGYLLDTLTIVPVKGALPVGIDHAKQIKIVGWFGKRLLYTSLQADTSATDPQRYKLLSYDSATKRTRTLAATNTIDDVLAVPGAVYYAATAADNTSQLMRLTVSSGRTQLLLGKAVGAILRSDYNNLLFMTASSYYGAALTDSKPTAVTNTYNGAGRLYIDNPAGSRSAWLDPATSQLKIYDKTSGRDAVVAAASGAGYPLRWINNSTLLYRNSPGGGDYIVSVAGGSSQKIVGAASSAGLRLWQN